MQKNVLYSIVVLLVSTQNLGAQNVGIGTTSPTRAKLEVNGAVDATSAIFGGESSGISLQRNWPGIGFNTYWNGGNRYLSNGFGAKNHLDPGSGHMYLDMFSGGVADGLPPATHRALTISPVGNIGIGSAYPNAELQLPNTLANRKIVLWETANNNHQIFGLGIESGTMRYSVAGTGNVHRFYAGSGANSSTLLMSIWGNKTVIVGDYLSGSRMGINSGSPAYTLDIFQAPSGGGIRLLSTDFYNTNWEIKNAVYSNNDQTSCLQLIYNGNSIKGWFRPTDGGYSANSDLRLKENIENMEPVLDRLIQLRATRYEMKNENPGHIKSIGFIAQETQLLFPEVVDVLENKPDTAHPGRLPDQHGINYSALSVLAIKAIQEQEQVIKKQQQQIDILTKRLEALEMKNK